MSLPFQKLFVPLNDEELSEISDEDWTEYKERMIESYRDGKFQPQPTSIRQETEAIPYSDPGSEARASVVRDDLITRAILSAQSLESVKRQVTEDQHTLEHFPPDSSQELNLGPDIFSRVETDGRRFSDGVAPLEEGQSRKRKFSHAIGSQLPVPQLKRMKTENITQPDKANYKLPESHRVNGVKGIDGLSGKSSYQPPEKPASLISSLIVSNRDS